MEYPDTLAARKMRVETLLLMGRKDEARLLAEEWLAASTAFFGKDHPKTVRESLLLACICLIC